MEPEDTDKKLFLLNDAGSHPPLSNGPRPHPAGPHRWRKDGRRAVDGSVVRLKAIKVGGRWMTCSAWVSEFCEVLTYGAARKAVVQQEESAAAQARARKASGACDQAGL